MYQETVDFPGERATVPWYTFTEVANFGPGLIVPILDAVFPIGTPPAVPVGPPNFVPAGGTVTVSGLSAGTHMFMCLIHPWMQTIVEVEGDDDDDDDSSDDDSSDD